MTTIHLTRDKLAATALYQALGTTQCADRVIALSDDLTVGPLRDIDVEGDPGATQRAVFWQHTGGVSGTLAADDSAALAALEANDAHVVIWHANDAADQLMLRRACYRLRNAPQRLNEVRLADDDTSSVSAEARLRARLPDAAPISVLRITRLALEWQEAKFANGETRRWHNNTFTSAAWADLDLLILDILGTTRVQWLSPTALGAALLRVSADFAVSEPVILWRLRELAATDGLRLREDLYAAGLPDAPTGNQITPHSPPRISH